MFKKVLSGLGNETNGVDPGNRMVTRLQSAPVIGAERPTCQRFGNSVTFIGPNLWDSLTPETRNLSNLNEFKNLIKKKIKLEFLDLDSI